MGELGDSLVGVGRVFCPVCGRLFSRWAPPMEDVEGLGLGGPRVSEEERLPIVGDGTGRVLF